jgi:uncharacterized membrane protein YccC
MAKKDKDAQPESGGTGGIRLSSHPRARRDIAMAKSGGGLATFMIAAFLAQRAGMPFSEVVLRGLLAGLAGFVVAWVLAVVAWRHVALAQIEDLRRDLLAQQAARMLNQDAQRQQGDPGAPTIAK